MSNQYHPAGDSGQVGAIEIKTTMFPLAFLLHLFPAKLTIDDGAEIAHGWGTRLYPIPAGRHRLRAWCPYFFAFKLGELAHDIEVHSGQVTGVNWTCPWLVFLPGKWNVLGMRPVGVGEPAATTLAPTPQPQLAPQSVPGGEAPSGWHPDPHGQAAMRWWDGRQWTEHTHNG